MHSGRSKQKVLVRASAPRRYDRVWNLTVLWYVAKLRRHYIGTYYFEDTNSLHPVLELDAHKLRELPKRLFQPIDPKLLEESYRMVCIPRCGACCERNAGAFAFDFELHRLGLDILQLTRCEKLKLLNGVETTVCELPQDVQGACVFYDRDGRRCRVHSIKPVICLVSYCSLVAEKHGSLYVKASMERGKPIYIPWRGSLSDLAHAVREWIRALHRVAQNL